MTRIPDVTSHRRLMELVNGNGARLADRQLEIASGIRLQRPSDDIASANRALTSLSASRRVDGRASATRGVEVLATAAESALGSLQDLLSDARVVAVQALNDTLDPETAVALAEEVDQGLEAMLEAANRRNPGGTYVFGGPVTDTPPYTATRDAEGRITTITPTPGIEVPIERLVGDTTATFPITGPGVLADGGDVFGAVIGLRDAIEANDWTAVDAGRAELESVQSHVGTQQARMGSFQKRVADALTRLDDDAIVHEAERSRAMDTDIAEAVVQLSNEETFYQAALQMTARVSELNLMRFL